MPITSSTSRCFAISSWFGEDLRARRTMRSVTARMIGERISSNRFTSAEIQLKNCSPAALRCSHAWSKPLIKLIVSSSLSLCATWRVVCTKKQAEWILYHTSLFVNTRPAEKLQELFAQSIGFLISPRSLIGHENENLTFPFFAKVSPRQYSA